MRFSLCLLLICLAGCSTTIDTPASLRQKLEAEQKLADEVKRKLAADIKAANDSLAEEQKKVETLQKEQEKLRAEKEELTKDLKESIAAMEVLSSSPKEVNEKTDAAQGTITANTQDVAYLKKDVNERVEKIAVDIGLLKNVDQLLKGEYVALRNDVTQTMERGNVTEAELSKLSDRSKILHLRVLTARAREAEEFVREFLQPTNKPSSERKP